MYLKPLESMFDITQQQYVFIDQAIVGKLEGFDDVKISLGLKADVLNAEHYPILLDLSKLDQEMYQHLMDRHQAYLDYYQVPLISLAFNLKKGEVLPKNFDIVNFLYTLFYYEKSEKKYLRRLYDPKVILQLNSYDEEKDLLSEIFYPIQSLSVYFSDRWYSFKLSETLLKEKIDHALISNIDLSSISYANRLVNKLNLSQIELGLFLHICKSVYKNLMQIRKDNHLSPSSVDTLALLFHMQLLGEDYLSLDQTLKLLTDLDGYDQASKSMNDSKWDELFKQLNVSDINLKNKVKYEY